MTEPADQAPVAGLLLAAGAGRRMGRPKALVPGWLAGGVGALLDGGVDRVLVVLGAAPDALDLLPADLVRLSADGRLDSVVAPDWAEGMGASLRAGLTHLSADPATAAALVHLVDLPDVGPDVVRRLLAAGAEGGEFDETVLARAAYDGRLGHPVLIGRAHWSGVVASASGDRGAREYLREHPAVAVECGDLATGHDVDRPT